VNDAYAADDAAPAEAAKAEAAELLAAIGAVRRVARRAVRGSATSGALPPARSELLRLAARRPGIGVAEAAQELRLAPNSVSTMVSQLAAAGLLHRGRAPRGSGSGATSGPSWRGARSTGCRRPTARRSAPPCPRSAGWRSRWKSSDRRRRGRLGTGRLASRRFTAYRPVHTF
jgi:hypothetical protein